MKEAKTTSSELVIISTENMEDDTTISESFIDDNFGESTISISLVESEAKTTGKTWKISFTSGVINCSFHMKVVNNKCTSVYNKEIITIGCTYSDAKLTHSTTYGKLSMDITSLGDLAKGTFGLKGTVTGENNGVKTTLI